MAIKTKNPFLGILTIIAAILVSYRAEAIQYVIIRSEKAIVYADREMTTAIGYIREGKQVPVAGVFLSHGAVVPIALAGKLAYMRAKNLRFVGEEPLDSTDASTSKKITEHDLEQEYIPLEDITGDNYVSFQLSNMTFEEDWAVISSELGEADTPNGNNLRVMFEHRPSDRWFTWAVGFSVTQQSQENISYQGFNLEGSLYFTPIDLKVLSVDLVASVYASPIARIGNELGEAVGGNMFGTSYGLQGRLFPYSKIGFLAGVSFYTYNLTGFDTIEFESSTQNITQVETIAGTSIYAGLTYRFGKVNDRY